MNKRIVFCSSLTVVILAAPSLLNANRINPEVSRFQTLNEFAGKDQKVENQKEKSTGAAYCYSYERRSDLTNPGSGPGKSFLPGGEQVDSKLGGYYLRARYYQPGTGRFWTMDPFEGNQQHPPSLHKYLYCQDNPITYVDPSGKAVYKVKFKSSFPLIDHRVIVGDTGTNYSGSCYVLEFWGNDGVLLGSKWEPMKWAKWHYSTFEISAKAKADELIATAGSGKIVATVITSVDVDMQLNEEASELDGQDGMWIMIYNDCGTGANAWLREARDLQNRQHPPVTIPPYLIYQNRVDTATVTLPFSF
jgi:RHS repeat-associated protein